MNFLLSSNILLLSTFLLISYFPTYSRAGRESHIIADFKSDCTFYLGGYSFNLCPLAGTKYSRDVIGNSDIDLVEKPSSQTKLQVYEVAQGLSLLSTHLSKLDQFLITNFKAHFKHFSVIAMRCV